MLIWAGFSWILGPGLTHTRTDAHHLKTHQFIGGLCFLLLSVSLCPAAAAAADQGNFQ
ncbi:hypothetical protein OIU84_021011 [Salix udensis]|uniref:Uncharacterized protein n=1 Tax=Salix udensis TaxID=889485 RepID=A0AAD6KVR2_9ROSI|nr:hypothetical protein OIU84_021011 [Salix udensis]